MDYTTILMTGPWGGLALTVPNTESIRKRVEAEIKAGENERGDIVLDATKEQVEEAEREYEPDFDTMSGETEADAHDLLDDFFADT